jgi:hypothetical protein
MANSRSKYTRARIRARGRRRQRRGGSAWFYGALAVIVAGFVAVGVVTLSDRSNADVPPQPGNPATGAPGDHWHAAFGANVCGEWLSNPATFETASDNPNVRVGIHTHGDGFIHVHPFFKSEGGDNATLGKFLGYGGWGASEDSLSLWTGMTIDPNKTDWSTGDKCPPGSQFAGQKGVVKWSLDCKDQTGDPSDLKLRNGDVIALAFLPKDQPIGTPPNADLAPSNDGGSTTPLKNKSCKTAGPGATATTLPATTAATSATTAAPSATAAP